MAGPILSDSSTAAPAFFPESYPPPRPQQTFFPPPSRLSLASSAHAAFPPPSSSPILHSHRPTLPGIASILALVGHHHPPHSLCSSPCSKQPATVSPAAIRAASRQSSDPVAHALPSSSSASSAHSRTAIVSVPAFPSTPPSEDPLRFLPPQTTANSSFSCPRDCQLSLYDPRPPPPTSPNHLFSSSSRSPPSAVSSIHTLCHGSPSVPSDSSTTPPLYPKSVSVHNLPHLAPSEEPSGRAPPPPPGLSVPNENLWPRQQSDPATHPQSPNLVHYHHTHTNVPLSQSITSSALHHHPLHHPHQHQQHQSPRKSCPSKSHGDLAALWNTPSAPPTNPTSDIHAASHHIRRLSSASASTSSSSVSLSSDFGVSLSIGSRTPLNITPALHASSSSSSRSNPVNSSHALSNDHHSGLSTLSTPLAPETSSRALVNSLEKTLADQKSESASQSTVPSPKLVSSSSFGTPLISASSGTGGQSQHRYQCTQVGCHKTFSRPSSLKIHSYSHTGQKPFQCMRCDRAFSVQSNLKRHQKVHERKSAGMGRLSIANIRLINEQTPVGKGVTGARLSHANTTNATTRQLEQESGEDDDGSESALDERMEE